MSLVKLFVIVVVIVGLAYCAINPVTGNTKNLLTRTDRIASQIN